MLLTLPRRTGARVYNLARGPGACAVRDPGEGTPRERRSYHLAAIPPSSHWAPVPIETKHISRKLAVGREARE